MVGRDQAVAKILTRISRLTSLRVYIAFVSKTETGRTPLYILANVLLTSGTAKLLKPPVHDECGSACVLAVLIGMTACHQRKMCHNL